MLEVNDFDAIRISLATPEQIRNWSYGEVAKPETINYRTLKPERDGLFCERIFGPIKEFECSCGKYKRIRYKGIICDKCGVEVARSKVRRERMGHIELACPVGHIWFSRGIPSRLGLLLDMSPRNLERVLYFARYIITHVDGEACQEALNQIEEKKQQKITNHDEGLEAKVLELEQNGAKVGEINKLRKDWAEEKALLKEQFSIEIDQIKALRVRMLLSENQYHAVKRDYGEIVKAGMGAEAILELVKTINLEELRDHLLQELQSSSGQKHRKASKQLQVVEALRRSGNKPETMILTILPVLPPDLRPMVQLDGGRFATSDLNDLYRRVINRNNRLRHLLEIGAPEIIVRNEKRMLQEAVDSLIDNERRGRAASVSGTHKLKSLSDMLRSKQGRFRQNLLGKRVDYSGRSVIVVGPELKLHQCGLPRRMALELFKPFIMHRLIAQGLAHNIRSSRRLVERAKPEVYDILEEVVKERPVLLNRAPTLHRLSIQAFEPVLIDGSAIQIHPLVCAAFNADFDGDQMAVHLPLSKAAIREARSQLLSTRNMLVPSNGEPLVTPTLDMVLGCFYLTSMESGVSAKKIIFGSFEEARLSYELGIMNLRAEIEVRDKKTNGQRIKTTIGRIIFNEVLPPELGFLNKSVDRAELKHVVTTCYRLLGHEDMGTLLDNLKQMGFHFATKSGTTIGMNDIKVPVDKPELLQQAEERVALIDNQYEHGLITEDEKYNGVIEVWSETTDKITESISRTLDRYGGVYTMASSGAKGNISQIRQMAGIRGLMTDPSGKIIDFPIKSSLREGHSVLEYFISTHGARKGLADTALRTSNSGYLTRRLIDVAQDVITREFDCDTNDGTWVTAAQAGDLLPAFAERITGRLAASQIINSKTGEIVVDRNEEINELKVKDIDKAGIKKIHVRSPVKCQSRHGCCQRCYGRDLGRGNIVGPGTAVGIIAAQSIGEPGTQLTLRTFHTGGVVGLDITTGLPRVEELFEVRSPKVQAVISEIDGVVDVIQNDERRTLQVTRSEIFHDEYPLSAGAKVEVKDGQWVDIGTVLLVSSAKAKGKKGTKGTKGTKGVLADSQSVIARVSGEVVIDEKQLSIKYEEQEEREYDLPPAARIRVQSGDLIKAGDQLTEGPLNPQDILRVLGTEAVQQYLVDEVQKVYRSQGVNINDKHIEVIVHQMLGKVRVDSSGDTELVPDELVGKFRYEDVNAKVLAEGGEPATAHTIMVGITRASLSSDSWLAAASFQETTRVLTEAAISGKVDKLSGLKENVIIGKLIPAYCPEPENEQERLLEEVSEQAEELRMGDVEEKSPLEEEAVDEIREVSEN